MNKYDHEIILYKIVRFGVKTHTVQPKKISKFT